MHSRILTWACWVIAAMPLASGLATAAAENKQLVGQKIADFSLRDAGGKAHSLASFADKQLLVVAFVGTECPLAKLYAPRLNELAERYRDRQVGFLAIDSNQQDSLAELQNFVRSNSLSFPVLKDVDARVADAFGAQRTPQVFLLDRDRTVRYVGRIDDQYGYDRGLGYQRLKASTHDLATAIDQLTAGQVVSMPQTEVAGCLIGRPKTPKTDSQVTYSKQIARIFQNRCQECHRPGEIGPFALDGYEAAAGWGEMIREVVREERMPPWGADPKYGDFLNNARLSDEEKRQIDEWVANGCPQGNPSDLPAPRTFVEGWSIPTPDQVLYMSEQPATIPAEGTVEYQYFEVDPGWKEDVWIKAAETRPGNRGVVHHIIVFIKPPNERALSGPSGLGPTNLLAGFAPGTPPMSSDRGYARHVKAGSKLIFQMHYTPNGAEQQDRSYIGLVFTDAKSVTHQAHSGFAMQLNLDIPANDDDYVAHSKYKFRKDTLVLSYMPHMHWRGKSFRYEVEYPDGRHEVLLEIPRYDFNWQLVYILNEPKFFPAGSILRCEAHFDNSSANLANPDPSKRVRWGDQTWEEMMIGWFVSADALPEDKPKTQVTGSGG